MFGYPLILTTQKQPYISNKHPSSEKYTCVQFLQKLAGFVCFPDLHPLNQVIPGYSWLLQVLQSPVDKCFGILEVIIKHSIIKPYSEINYFDYCFASCHPVQGSPCPAPHFSNIIFNDTGRVKSDEAEVCKYYKSLPLSHMKVVVKPLSSKHWG